MSKKVKLKSSVIVAIVFFGFMFLAAKPMFSWSQGCTPGFWKNHLEHWVIFSPDQTLGDVFVYQIGWPSQFAELLDDTLLEALNYKGGPGLLGAARIMLRQAVASLLNCAHPDVDHNQEGIEWYPRHIESWLWNLDRDYILFRGWWFQIYNELGSPICD
jgi:hypothetical protein